MNNKLFLYGMGSALFVVLLIFLFYRIPAIKISSGTHSYFLKSHSFEIGWIHSVEKEPWYETYQVQNKQLVLTTTRFKTFGAGTPSDGEIIPSTDGYIHMKINQLLENVSLTISENTKTTLYTKSSAYPLYELFGHHQSISIKPVQAPLWQVIGRDLQK